MRVCVCQCVEERSVEKTVKKLFFFSSNILTGQKKEGGGRGEMFIDNSPNVSFNACEQSKAPHHSPTPIPPASMPQSSPR